MPLSTDFYSTLDDLSNRLAGESILAQAGRDEGLIPSYSLLGELIELCSVELELREPLSTLKADLERLLDSAQPFDDAALTHLRNVVKWLPAAATASKADQPLPPVAGKAAAAPAAAESAPASVAASSAPVDDGLAANDLLQDLNLDENRELLTEFHAEALDHLQQIEAALLALDETPDDPEALNSIFRSFHTIKGVSGFLHLTPMHTLTHEVESLLDLARNRKLRLNSTIITEILKSRDAVQNMVGQITVALEQGTLPSEIIPVSHLIRAVKRLAAGESAPVAAAPAKAAAPIAASVAAAPAELAPVVPFSPAPSAEAPAPAKAAEHKEKAAATGETKNASSSTVRVNTEKLDSLMDVVGELVIVQSQLTESARVLAIEDASLQRNITQFGRLTKELQHTSMSLRMIPVKPTFQKMERLVRDLSRDFGKKVNFHVSGEDTELDRTVVEDIGDPLVHMVRNSLDHGLESTADRIAAGKTEAGNVHLKAYHEGGNIVIELSDDGRGINTDKVLAKARKQNLIPENAQLSKDEVLHLIFLPGFSTAEKVTAVSGRGVGMDVVKRNIEKLRGKIEITSEMGKGSTFRIKLPLTMAIIDGLVVRVGEDRFILPSTSVQMALRPAKDALSTVHGHGEVLDHRGKILPIHRLHRRFQIAGAIENPWDGIIVIVESNGRASALLVDDMVSKQEVVIKSLGGFLQNLVGVSGGAILGDGGIALILDPTSLFNAA
ncbi:chemotaxis protein CheA [Nibricoccus aquaticus]|uniref:Chemotaxis protein CheA n=1 Tax=Nibricoccus aquaticus TaxID=2576891 RepID=A0A290QCA6_9BACT|nr:chemotaxis protein CheA [Nibricoccus aquaticus]ATC66083.1 chemotaxis protein CheA [Nibricoccus aquaticus]